MVESNREWIKRFIVWLQGEDEPEYGDNEEMYLLAESFYNEDTDCPLSFDQLVNGFLNAWCEIV